MTTYEVTGMTCAACSARVEKAVKQVEGVNEVSVNLLLNLMQVEGSAKSKEVIRAVEKAGYGAVVLERGKKQKEVRERAIEHPKTEWEEEERNTKVRLVVSLVLLLPLMYLSMGHVMWGWPVFGGLERNPLKIALWQLVLAQGVMFVNRKFFINGFNALFHRAPNMDTLVALGSLAAFLTSWITLGDMTEYYVAEEAMSGIHGLHALYFESAAMILTLITVGKMLEERAKGKTTDALEGLMKLAPETATIRKDGKECIVSVDRVMVGDVFLLRPGQRVPVDGRILEGDSALDESALTGESIPVDKKTGDIVTTATINLSGFLVCEAVRTGEDTTFAGIVKLVREASGTKAPIAKLADKVAGKFVPAVLILSMITFVVWIMQGQQMAFAMERAISVLVISCPCALGLATPVAIMVATGKGASLGVLYKNASALERCADIQIVVLDKTGTLTKGKPQVTDVCPADGISKEQLLKTAFFLERRSEHPIAKALTAYAKEQHAMSEEEALEWKEMAGNGLFAKNKETEFFGGNRAYIETVTCVEERMQKMAEKFSMQGKTPIFFAKKNKLFGVIAVADVLKKDSVSAVQIMKQMGLNVVMLTGDNRVTATTIAKQAGIDEVYAEVLPEGKKDVVEKLKKQGKVMMVGDGINDAPALVAADIGVAVASGTDVAMNAAEVVLVANRLFAVVQTIRLSRATVKNIKENLFWAFLYNTLGIPIAAGILYPSFGMVLNPMIGAVAMSLSSFCVVTNALRLNHKNFTDSLLLKYSEKKSGEEEKEKKMEKTLEISGMMCMHCSGRVKKVLEALEGVTEAVVDHETGTAIVRSDAEIETVLITQTVEAEGYEVVNVR